MAKRKRLSPLGFGAEEPSGIEAIGGDIPPTPALPRRGARAPIADIAGAAAANAALEDMAQLMHQAREEGRMVLALPLEEVLADHLVRDRLVCDADEMEALVTSLRLRGQQTPIEVLARPEGGYGLISGWRRLTALRGLLAETGDQARFGTVLALLRRPEHSADAYQAMVEENEIRAGLSFYERARIVDQAVKAGVFADDRAALRGLFGSVARAKRSKIGSFLVVLRALEGALRFPEAISERLGLQLAQALQGDAELRDRLQAALKAASAANSASELAVLQKHLLPNSPQKPVLQSSAGKTGPQGTPRKIANGLILEQINPHQVTLSGPRVDAELIESLVKWLEQSQP